VIARTDTYQVRCFPVLACRISTTALPSVAVVTSRIRKPATHMLIRGRPERATDAVMVATISETILDCGRAEEFPARARRVTRAFCQVWFTF